MTLPNTGGFQGVQYNTDHAGISPGHGNPSSGNPGSQAMAARASGGQEGNYINSDAMAAATEIPDLPTGTLYVFMFKGRVYKMNIQT